MKYNRKDKLEMVFLLVVIIGLLFSLKWFMKKELCYTEKAKAIETTTHTTKFKTVDGNIWEWKNESCDDFIQGQTYKIYFDCRDTIEKQDDIIIDIE